MKTTKLHRLEHWQQKRHVATLIWAAPYPVCKAKKRFLEANRFLNKGEYLKITKHV